MKRRDFLRTSGAAAGLLGSLDASPGLPVRPKGIPKNMRSAADGQSSG